MSAVVFKIVTFLVFAITFLSLAFHRFWTTRQEAKATILYIEIFKKYLAWLALRTIQIVRQTSAAAWWQSLKALPLWRLPVVEKGLFVCLYGSFLYLATSGFFFALFIPRGLFGYLLIGHAAAGGLFAVCLTTLIVFKGRSFISVPRPMSLSLTLLDPRKIGLTAARAKNVSFWIFSAAGFLLTLSALLPMLPLLRTAGQKAMLEFHKYSALLAVAAAIVFVGLELFESRRA